MKLSRFKIVVVVLLLAGLLTACGESGPTAEDLGYSNSTMVQGELIFNQTCFTCHGLDGKGLPNQGRDLTESEFIMEHTDQELLEYVLKGRAVDDPLNTTGIEMPPKGGFDFLTDEEILSAIAYIRLLQE